MIRHFRFTKTIIVACAVIVAVLAAGRAHAQVPTLLPEPTGGCPDYLTATAWKNVPEGQAPKYTLDKVQMQCKQGMCHRCPPKPDGTVDTRCTLADAKVKTDIPCNYSIDDMFVTALNAVRIIFALTGAIALALFIWGGFRYWILSAGDSGKVKEGKSLMVNSLIAIIITFGAGAIVTFVVRGLGAEIGVDNRGAIGQIVADPKTRPECPTNGTQGQDCVGREEENVTCYYGPDVAIGNRAPFAGVCIDTCRYNSLPPDPSLVNDEKGTYQCTDRNLLTPAQQQTCKQGLCPGAANVQCCKL